MTVEEMTELFETLGETVGLNEFDKLPKKLSKRQDLHAFLLLDQLFPDKDSDIICSAEHDQIWLDVELEELAEIATEELIRELVACGCFIDDNEYLSMFA